MEESPATETKEQRLAAITAKLEETSAAKVRAAEQRAAEIESMAAEKIAAAEAALAAAQKERDEALESSPALRSDQAVRMQPGAQSTASVPAPPPLVAAKEPAAAAGDAPAVPLPPAPRADTAPASQSSAILGPDVAKQAYIRMANASQMDPLKEGAEVYSQAVPTPHNPLMYTARILRVGLTGDLTDSESCTCDTW